MREEVAGGLAAAAVVLRRRRRLSVSGGGGLVAAAAAAACVTRWRARLKWQTDPGGALATSSKRTWTPPTYPAVLYFDLVLTFLCGDGLAGKAAGSGLGLTGSGSGGLAAAAAVLRRRWQQQPV